MSVENKVVIFIGTGGVGKTTLSALYALSLDGGRTLITIDPSKRLKDLFNDGESSQKDKDLNVSLNDRNELFNNFLDENILDKSLLDKFKSNSLFNSLMNNLSVSQEFTSFYELVKYYEDPSVSKLILDTPPLQNSNDFFSGAVLLEQLFSGKLVSFFIPDEERGFASKVFNRSREIALTALSKLTGSEFIRELSEFFVVSQRVRGPLIETLRQARSIILNSSDLYFVTSYEELSLRRVGSTFADLEEKGLQVKKCFINRYYKLDEVYEQALDKIVEDLVNRYKDIMFIKVDMIKEEPNNMEKLNAWSKDVTF